MVAGEPGFIHSDGHAAEQPDAIEAEQERSRER